MIMLGTKPALIERLVQDDAKAAIILQQAAIPEDAAVDPAVAAMDVVDDEDLPSQQAVFVRGKTGVELPLPPVEAMDDAENEMPVENVISKQR